MRVKKFEAKNMKDALQMVKNELGPDAVILSAKDNRKSFGLAGETSVEITAAVSESTLNRKHYVESRMTTGDKARFSRSDAKTQRNIIEQMVENRMTAQAQDQTHAENKKRPMTSVSYIDIPDEEVQQNPRRTAALERARGRNVNELLNGFEQDFSPADAFAPPPVRPSARTPAANSSNYGAKATTAPAPVAETAMARIRSAAREAWAAGTLISEPTQPEPQQLSPARAQAIAAETQTVQTAARAQQEAQQAQQEERQTRAKEEVDSLKGEIGRLQKMLEGFSKVPQTFATMHPGADFGIPYDLSFMFQKLVESGVTVENTVEILQAAAKEIDPVQVKKQPIVDAWVARWFLNNTRTVERPWQGRVHLFVGGSGSGKTSTLVKMASHLVVKEKKKVAILTTDSFKVGAVDQLKIYCQILNVPFAVIRNRNDWEWVMSQLRFVDHILVDFPGFQLRDLDEIHLLKSLLPPEGTAPTCHFCVAATSKDGDAYEIAKRYRVAEFSDIVVTNLDQSVQHGIVYNLTKKTGLPLHSFGIGSRLPEDYEAASKERVLDLIFKLTKLRRETK